MTNIPEKKTQMPYTPMLTLSAMPVVGMTVKIPIPFGFHDFNITIVARDYVILSTFFDGKRVEIKRRPSVVL